MATAVAAEPAAFKAKGEAAFAVEEAARYRVNCQHSIT